MEFNEKLGIAAFEWDIVHSSFVGLSKKEESCESVLSQIPVTKTSLSSQGRMRKHKYLLPRRHCHHRAE